VHGATASFIPITTLQTLLCVTKMLSIALVQSAPDTRKHSTRRGGITHSPPFVTEKTLKQAIAKLGTGTLLPLLLRACHLVARAGHLLPLACLRLVV